MDNCSEESESSLEQEDLRESTRNLNPTVGTVHSAIAQNITSASHKRASGDGRENYEYLEAIASGKIKSSYKQVLAAQQIVGKQQVMSGINISHFPQRSSVLLSPISPGLDKESKGKHNFKPKLDAAMIPQELDSYIDETSMGERTMQSTWNTTIRTQGGHTLANDFTLTGP